MERVKVYLAGAMKGLSEAQIQGWRRILSDKIYKKASDLDVVADVINPADYFSYDNPVHYCEKEIKQFELNHVRSSNILVVRLDGVNTSVGTILEVREAEIHDIPVIAFNPNNISLDFIHPWISSAFVRVCNTSDEIADYISEYYM